MARKPQTNVNIGAMKMHNEKEVISDGNFPDEATEKEAFPSHLIAMFKDGETIHVHENNVLDHEGLGWVKVAE